MIISRNAPEIRQRKARLTYGTNLLSILIFSIFYSLTWMLISQFIPEVIYMPSASNALLLMIGLIITLQIKIPLARYALMFWFGWFIIGSISIAANNMALQNDVYYFDPSDANNFYLLCLISGAIGALICEFISNIKRKTHKSISKKSYLSFEIWSILIIFPFLYAGSIVAISGDIPIISGRDVSASMYQTDYGPLIGFGIYIPVITIMIGIGLINQKGLASLTPRTIISLALLFAYLLMASFDGRRVFTLFSVAGLLLYYLSYSSGPGRWFWTLGLSFASLTAYVMAAAVRTGSSAQTFFRDAILPLTVVGVEYRDFVYGYINFPREVVANSGYDWVGSTLAASIPSALLTPLGIDKSKAILHDSARTMMDLRGVDLGVRIGLPGELWFEFGWAAAFVFMLFGMLVYATARLATKTSNLAYKAILLVQLAIYMLAVNGQSTVTFGLTLPLIYLAIAIPVINWLSPGRKMTKPRSNRSDNKFARGG